MAIVAEDNSTSKNARKEMTYLSDFLVYHSNVSYTVIIFAVNSQGNSAPASESIGMFCVFILPYRIFFCEVLNYENYTRGCEFT